MRNRTECTGFRAAITMTALATQIPAKRYKNSSEIIVRRPPRFQSSYTASQLFSSPSPVRRIERQPPRFQSSYTASQLFSSPSPVRRIERQVLRDLALPAIAVRKQALFVVIELLARLGREFEIWAFDDGVDRTGLLAEPAINAFHHIDVITRRSARAVIAPRAGLDGDRLRRTDRLA